jgi:hypothetical protein
LASLVSVYRGVLLYGDSGSGKSSLVNAGLITEAIRLGLAPERLRVQPRASAELVVERIDSASDGEKLLPSVLAPGEESSTQIVLATDAFEQRVRAACKQHLPLLIFDQFEEIVTLFDEARARDAQQRLVGLLVRLLRGPLPVKILFAFREDYLGKLKELLSACPELVDQALRIAPPTSDALPTIIRGPFDRYPDHFAHQLSPSLADHLAQVLAKRFGADDISLSEVQTVCLRLWQSDNPEVLLAEKGPQGLLEDYLGEALDRMPAELRAAAIALLGQMVTSAGTRNVISADDLFPRVQEQEGAITPKLLTQALERLSQSRLVRRESRRDLELYEIASEFLVPWISRRRDEFRQLQDRRRRTRRQLTMVFMVLLAGLLVLFPFLRAPTDETLVTKASGAVVGSMLKIPFPPVPDGYVAVVHVSLAGQTRAGASVGVVVKDQGKKQEKELAHRTVASSEHGEVKATVNFAIKTAQPGTYAVVLEAPQLHSTPQGFLNYVVTVRSAPVILDVKTPGTSRRIAVDSSLFAVKLYPNQPLYLQFLDAEPRQVWAAHALMGNAGVVVESSGREGYAVLWINGSRDPLLPPPEVTGQLVGQGPDLFPGTHVKISAENVSVTSVHPEQANEPFAVEALCSKDQFDRLDLVDNGGRSVANTAWFMRRNSVLVPAAHGSGYSLIMLPNYPGAGLNCRVSIRSFAQQKITTASNRSIKIHPDMRFNAYPIRLPSDAAIIVTNLYGASASLNCFSGNIMESTLNRLVAFAPRNHDCVLSITRSPNKLGKLVSFPLQIVPISGR